MKGPSFVTALLRDEANCFITLRFLAAPQLVADLQIPPSLTATFLYAFPGNRCLLICFRGCSLILKSFVVWGFFPQIIVSLLAYGLECSHANHWVYPAMVDFGSLREAGLSKSRSVTQTHRLKERHVHLSSTGSSKPKGLHVQQQNWFSGCNSRV